jgi:hypothetical protein
MRVCHPGPAARKVLRMSVVDFVSPPAGCGFDAALHLRAAEGAFVLIDPIPDIECCSLNLVDRRAAESSQSGLGQLCMGHRDCFRFTHGVTAQDASI